MSSVLDGISDPDDEPLWAVDKEDLSSVTSLTIGYGCELTPESNLGYDEEGIVKVTGEATWNDD
nr:MAG TPA: hypothetical protein [Caudoviricetes sp.]